MPAPTPEQTELGYHRMWDASHVNANKVEPAKSIAGRIKNNRATYEAIAKATRVPWPMIGALHSRESDLNFKTHLHNGDPLTRRTYHVPANRPKAGSPPFTFQESAVDALTMSPHNLNKVTLWTAERILYECEKYNGWGYLKRGNSPYLWSWTDLYHGGKFVSNGRYQASAWDSQAGVVAIFKELIAIDASVAAYFVHREGAPPQEANDHATKRERAARAAGGAGAVTGGGSEGAKQTLTEQPVDQDLFLPPAVAYPLIGIGIAVVLVTTFLVARKKALILAKWTGGADTHGPDALIPPAASPPEVPAAAPPAS